jgi:hypothetical protein
MNLSSCEPPQQAFESIQICVGDANGVETLAQELRLFAAQEKMIFIDNTSYARRGLAATSQSADDLRESKWVVMFVVQNSRGLGVTATNLGGGRFDFGLGFTSGGEPDAASQFANRLEKRLATHWAVHHLPPGQGALPSSCPA